MIFNIKLVKKHRRKNIQSLVAQYFRIQASRPSIHFFPLIRSQIMGQKPKQRGPDCSIPSYLGQLIWRNPKVLPGQVRHIAPPACPGPSSGLKALKQIAYLPGMKIDIKDCIQGCLVCGQFQPTRHHRAPLQSRGIAIPWSDI